MDWFRFETRSSSPYNHNGLLFTVHSWVLEILLPGFGGLIWNYPIAVSVRTGEEGEERIPIVDVTRLVQLALLGVSVLGALFLWRKRS